MDYFKLCQLTRNFYEDSEEMNKNKESILSSGQEIGELKITVGLKYHTEGEDEVSFTHTGEAISNRWNSLVA
jgi:hypothetical protein